jgi:hypothetical protein
MCAGVSSPLACRVLSNWLCGNWRIFRRIRRLGRRRPVAGFGAAGDRQHFQVQILGQALVEAQFFVAEMLAGLQLVKSRKPKFTGFFTL